MKQIRKIIFYIITIIRNHPTNKSLDELIIKCIWIIENCPDVEIDISYYCIKIKTTTTTIEFWNGNKYYSWLSSGKVNLEHWNSCMPSREKSFEFKECLIKRGFNISPINEYSNENIKIDSSKIRC